MPPLWFILPSTIALNAVSVVGIMLILLGLLGREDLSHPRCRRCGCDLRPLARRWAGDAAASGWRRATCPRCQRALRGRAVRWRPYPTAWRAVGIGAALLVVSIGAFMWGLSRARRGLTWRDLVPVTFDLRSVAVDGYPGVPSSSSAGPSAWQMRTWQPDPWSSLNRRAAAGELSTETLAAAGQLVDRAVVDRGGLGRPWASRGLPSARANLLIAILNADLDPALRHSAATALVSPPDMTVDVDGQPLSTGSVQRTTRIALGLATKRYWELWGDHSQTLETPPREQRLNALCWVREVWLDGAPIPFTLEGDQRRSGAYAPHRYDGAIGTCAMPAVTCLVDAPPGPHEVALVIDLAVVDFALVVGLVADEREPGPPERWGARTIVRREIVRRTITVADPNAARPRDRSSEEDKP